MTVDTLACAFARVSGFIRSIMKLLRARVVHLNGYHRYAGTRSIVSRLRNVYASEILATPLRSFTSV